jgi:hypothetical protein
MDIQVKQGCTVICNLCTKEVCIENYAWFKAGLVHNSTAFISECTEKPYTEEEFLEEKENTKQFPYNEHQTGNKRK